MENWRLRLLDARLRACEEMERSLFDSDLYLPRFGFVLAFGVFLHGAWIIGAGWLDCPNGRKGLAEAVAAKPLAAAITTSAAAERKRLIGCMTIPIPCASVGASTRWSGQQRVNLPRVPISFGNEGLFGPEKDRRICARHGAKLAATAPRSTPSPQRLPTRGPQGGGENCAALSRLNLARDAAAGMTAGMPGRH
jgi:hypothetical protein